MTIRTWSGKVTPPADVSSASDVTISLHYLGGDAPPSDGMPYFFLGSILDQGHPDENGEFTLTFDDSEIPNQEPFLIGPPALVLVIVLPTMTGLPMWILGPYDPNGDPLE